MRVATGSSPRPAVRRRTNASFFRRPTLVVARELLGRRLVHEEPDGARTSGTIVEVEAYVGEADLACHASSGPTARNAVMYRAGGLVYVYLIYGMHRMCNLVTEREGFPAAVLIRALEAKEGLEGIRARRAGATDRDLLRGPGRLCRGLGIELQHWGCDLSDGPLRVETGVRVPDADVVAGPRIGVDYAGEWANRPWRLGIAGHACLSAPFGAARPRSVRTGIARRRTAPVGE